MKLVLLDRDGVINEDSPHSVKSREEFVLLPGVLPAIKLLNEASIPVVIVTNQAVVDRGDLTLEGLEDIHQYLKETLEKQGAFIDKIYVCTSSDSQDPRRKPNPGLLLEAFEDFQVPPQEAVLIGDALRDLEAASAVKCPRILVRCGKGNKTLQDGLPDAVYPVTIFNDLHDAVSHLLNEAIG